jgi:thioredoxin reductase
VPGEDRSKVVYRLAQPEDYRGQHVLVVGGGDSALEAATTLAEERGTTVTLSYRQSAFTRAKPKNRQKVQEAERSGVLNVLMESEAREIGESSVRLEQRGQVIDLRNDAIIVCAGGVLPARLLSSVGIETETKYGTP